eukprot:CAMPEP_0177282606 /NCGR_PEP_ID=MMETSP0367-20130122/71551_1 /TAXON_ID=447022 ORGANISM="Scrippsiella hangoei-like, Strain SHHI-4" /NCGR_SAMPLE_ID=MMETSP0367 /ASSEMBLY_ACC=CAM_ASM_000362 /LENGTH=46 /DNA_ID= /DNA_START= /DNA_END= /DNA_ORIENTATION=
MSGLATIFGLSLMLRSASTRTPPAAPSVNHAVILPSTKWASRGDFG